MEKKRFYCNVIITKLFQSCVHYHDHSDDDDDDYYDYGTKITREQKKTLTNLIQPNVDNETYYSAKKNEIYIDSICCCGERNF